MILRNKDQQIERCWGRTDQTPALHVQLSSQEEYLFPYIHLSHAHLIKETDNNIQHLTIHFNNFTVSITGEQLKEIVLNLQKQTLEWVKVSKLKPNTKSRSLIITSIEVESTN